MTHSVKVHISPVLPDIQKRMLIWSFPGLASSWQGQYWDNNECRALLELLTGENWSTPIKVLSQCLFVYHKSHVHPGPAQWETGEWLISSKLYHSGGPTEVGRSEVGRSRRPKNRSVSSYPSYWVWVSKGCFLSLVKRVELHHASTTQYFELWVVHPPVCRVANGTPSSSSCCEWYLLQ